MAAAALLCLVVAGPAAKVQWSTKHPVGLRLPDTYKVLARDAGTRVLVAEGPRLGAGIPRLVLTHGGPATRPLEDFADKLVAPVKTRPGWTVVARTRKAIGVFPAIRFGLRFVEDGGKGRGRFTVALLGGDIYVLELSAHASRFPGAVFDRIEASLRVRWTEHVLQGGLVLRIPAGWTGEAGEYLGPQVSGLASMLRVWPSPRLSGPPKSRPGPDLVFLGAPRPSLVSEKEQARMRICYADGWIAMHVLPKAGWDDLAPTVEEILKTARLKKPPKR